jgi:hypothetical protein
MARKMGVVRVAGIKGRQQAGEPQAAPAKEEKEK